MVGHYIAQVSFQGNTELPKDRFVNTFHFLGQGEDVGKDCLGIATKLATFYNKDHVTAGQPPHVGAFLSAEIDSVASINIYDANTAIPRIPMTFHFTLAGGNPNNQKLPEEVALCLSFFSIRNRPTQRNRVYLGPLNITALGPAAGTLTSRPAPAFIDAIQFAAADMAVTDNGGAINASNALIDGLFLAGLAGLPGAPGLPSFLQNQDFPVANPVSWVVHSPIGVGTKAAPQDFWGFVTGGWVDNEWDGQSRRRVAASARVTFAA